jgi:hypothetical protein
VADAGKIALQLRQQLGVRAALKHFCDKRSAGLSTSDAKAAAPSTRPSNAQLIGLAMAGGVGGHVGQHHVGAAAHHAQQFFRRVVAEKIELRKADAGISGISGDRCDHLALPSAAPTRLARDLAPAAGRAPRSTR